MKLDKIQKLKNEIHEENNSIKKLFLESELNKLYVAYGPKLLEVAKAAKHAQSWMDTCGYGKPKLKEALEELEKE